MIVVIGGPVGGTGTAAVRAGGQAIDVARAAVAAGAAVQIVGRVGDDSIGDEVLLDLASAGIGHVAVLRSGGASTPTEAAITEADDLGLATALRDDRNEAADGSAPVVAEGLPIDAGDLELALRYLPDYRVLVVAADLDPAAWATAIAAASWSGARLVGIIASGSVPSGLPEDATILERPRAIDEGFGAIVGRYAAALDEGVEPAAAFATASSGEAWPTVAE